jgi:hypothetical protein
VSEKADERRKALERDAIAQGAPTNEQTEREKFRGLYTDLCQLMASIQLTAPTGETRTWRTHRVVTCTLEDWRAFWRERGIG